MMKRTGLGAAVLAILGLFGSEAGAKLYEVKATALNVRSGPSTSTRIVKVLKKRRAVNVVENKGGWKRIDWPNKGWVTAKYLSAGLRRYVKASAVNVRRGPGKSHGVIKRLNRGARVRVIAMKGHWRQITSPVNGWIHGKYLTSRKPGSGGSSVSTSGMRTFVGTAYRYGRAYRLTFVYIDGKAVAQKSAGPYLAMRAAARRSGIYLRVVSGFRTMAEQQYLWRLYGSPRAARPGYSPHQNGVAFDLNTGGFGTSIYNWLTRNAGRFGFRRTVSFEPWHWEYVR